MSIDNGPSVVDIVVGRGFIKTTTHGYVFTKKGIENLYEELATIKDRLNNAGNDVPDVGDGSLDGGFADQEPEA